MTHYTFAELAGLRSSKRWGFEEASDKAALERAGREAPWKIVDSGNLARIAECLEAGLRERSLRGRLENLVLSEELDRRFANLHRQWWTEAIGRDEKAFGRCPKRLRRRAYEAFHSTFYGGMYQEKISFPAHMLLRLREYERKPHNRWPLWRFSLDLAVKTKGSTRTKAEWKQWKENS